MDGNGVKVWQEELIRERYAKRDRQGRPVETSYDEVIERVISTFVCGGDLVGSLRDRRIVPASPVLMNAGQKSKATHFSCFPLGPVDDSTESIMSAVNLAWKIFQHGGGVGVDLSRLRSRGSLIRDGHGCSGGPNSFIGIFDAVAGGISQGGRRRGALMVTLDQDHPDIREFVERKRQPGVWENMNIAVMVYDWWSLRQDKDKYRWLCQSLWECGDPGLLFVDNQAESSPLMTDGLYEEYQYGRRESVPLVAVTNDSPFWVNPCAEYMAPAMTSCNLVSVNLDVVELDQIYEESRRACHFANQVLDLGLYPDKEIARRTRLYRPVGVGVTGLHMRMIKDGVKYNSSEGVEYAREVQRLVLAGSVAGSAEIAKENFSTMSAVSHHYDTTRFKEMLEQTKVEKAIDLYWEYGVVNSVTTVQAPAGSISQLVGCWSTGIEPLYSRKVQRRYRGESGEMDQVVEIEVDGVSDDDTALEMSPYRQLEVMAAMQECCHSAISKTVNMVKGSTVEDIQCVLDEAYQLGLKAVTVFRDGCRGERGQVVSAGKGSVSNDSEEIVVRTEDNNHTLPTRRDGVVVTIEGLINCHTILTDYDLFIIAGKGGSLLHSSFEALGRVVSLLLQQTPELYQAVARTLRGIDCGSTFRIPGVDRMFKSIPDAVAYLLDQEVDESNDGGWLDICPKCGTGSLRRVGGCNLCEQCGYSSC
jgi:ribonucleoside-diphosphate reductase alpha chain